MRYKKIKSVSLWRIHLLAEDESEWTDMKRFIIASYDLYAHVPTYHGFMKENFSYAIYAFMYINPSSTYDLHNLIECHLLSGNERRRSSNK
jgi:hypothetical protein